MIGDSLHPIFKNKLVNEEEQSANSRSLASSNSVLIVLIVMLIVLSIFVIIILQMSYWPRNVFKSHTYKRLNTLDDEEKLLSVETEEIGLERTKEDENLVA